MKRKYKVILTLIFIVYLNNLKMEVRVGYADLRLDNKDDHSNSFGVSLNAKNWQSLIISKNNKS